MFEWWAALSLTSQIFAIIGIAATLLLIVQVVLMLVGIGMGADFGGDTDMSMDADVDMDIDADADITDVSEVADMGLHVLSVRGIIAFFAVAGWTGVISDKLGAPVWLSVIIAFACGFITMLLVAILMRWIMGLQQDGTADIRNALGAAGTVYLRIPENRKGRGKVNIMLQGAYTELEAITDEAEELPYGAQIVVVGITGGNTLIVKKK